MLASTLIPVLTCCCLGNNPGDSVVAEFVNCPDQCGAWAVYQACLADGRNVTPVDVARHLPGAAQMYSVQELQGALDELGVGNVRRRFGDATPVVPGRTYILRVHFTADGMDAGHFVAAIGHPGRRFVVMEPSNGVSVLQGSDTENVTIDALIELKDRGGMALAWSALLVSLAAAVGWIVVRLASTERGKAGLAVVLLVTSSGVAGCSGGSGDSAPAPALSVGVENPLVIEPATAVELTPLGIPTTPGRQNAPVSGIGYFRVRNRSSRAVRITSLSTSCPCGTAKLSDRVIAAGGSVRCEVRAAGSTTSPTYLDVFVGTDLPRQKTLTVSTFLRATAETPVLLGPRPVRLGTVVGGHRSDIRLKTMEDASSPHWLHGADFNSPDARTGSLAERLGNLDASAVAGGLEVRGYRVNFTVPTAWGRFERTLRLYDAAGKCVAKVVVSGDSVPAVRGVPDVVRAIVVPDAAPLHRFVTLEGSEQCPNPSYRVDGALPEWLRVASNSQGDVFRLELSPTEAFDGDEAAPDDLEATVTFVPRSDRDSELGQPEVSVVVSLEQRRNR